MIEAQLTTTINSFVVSTKIEQSWETKTEYLKVYQKRIQKERSRNKIRYKL